MSAFTLAHLSDPHLGPLPPARFSELLGKRAIGHYNWHRKRHAIHRRDVLAQLVADLHAQRPDHIAITGDLVNIALPLEFAQAKSWLEGMGSPQDVSLVPGNHDAYVSGIEAHFPNAWSAYMQGDGAAGALVMFPYVRRRGPIVLIGVSSAVPSAPFMATGRLGQVQRDQLAKLLSEFGNEGCCRILLIHHPPVTAKGRWTARLTDSPALLEVLKQHGVELVLHGHDHRNALLWLDGPKGPAGKIPSVGVPSASVAFGLHYQPATYHFFSIERQDGGWAIAMSSRGIAKTTVGPDAAIVTEVMPSRLLRE